MGSKSRARQIMADAGVPVVPGYDGDDQDDAKLLAAARGIGFPVLLKASAGGGGKGMRVIRDEPAFSQALAGARREAAAAFGDTRMIVERYVTEPRHVEVQIIGDQHGEVLHLFERECSIQRRHQKIIEESPSPVVDAALRAAADRRSRRSRQGSRLRQRRHRRVPARCGRCSSTSWR